MQYNPLALCLKAVFVFLMIVSTVLPVRAQVFESDVCNSTLADGIAKMRLTQAEVVQDDEKYDPYCLVQGKVNERTGIDGKSYAIGFELRLPLEWNGRFLHQVNGGNDGVVLPAEGQPGQEHALGGQTAQVRGFAVLSSDAGHNGNDPVNVSAGLVAGNLFGLDPQARLDYGYAAAETMAPLAKTLISRFYGQQPSYSYMYGCSNGVRHSMVAATRHPEDYDGIIAGNPGFNLPKSAVQHAWDVQSFQIANPDIREAFSPEDMLLVAGAVLAACDELDGAKDGLVADLHGCQRIFDISSLTCSGEKEASCLKAAQVTALDRSMSGPVNSAGDALYAYWPYDGGLGSGNWRFWKLASGVPPWKNYPLIATLGGGSLSYIFTTPPTMTPGDPDSLVAYLSRFDFDKDALKIDAVDEVFRESAMEFMTPLDVDDPKLDALTEHGGKLLVYHGQSDGVFSAGDLINWYDRLSENHDGDASDFARLYLVPGMNHCGGGPATDNFDVLTAMMDWVESGVAPDRIIATVNPENPELPEDWSKSRTRPLCVWPKIATYEEGDLERAESFVCKAP